MNAKQTAEAATSADKKLRKFTALKKKNSECVFLCARLPALFGRRHFVTLMLFLGMANAYVMRTNMSVAIVAMVKHPTPANNDTDDDNSSAAAECPGRPPIDHHEDGEFAWSSVEQGNLLAAFFYGYVLTQIPFALLTNMYGAMRFLGWGMMANSVFAFFVPMAARYGGFWSVFVMRFVQGLGEGPIVPCTHAMLANWIPIQERTRLCAFVYAGAQFGTIVSMPVSGLLASLDWTYVFYVSGVVSTVWSVAFLVLVDEDPSSDRWISEAERSFIEGERVPIMADVRQREREDSRKTNFVRILNEFLHHFATTTETENSIPSDCHVGAVLCDSVCAHRPELRLRDANDAAADVHEIGAALLDQGERLLFRAAVSGDVYRIDAAVMDGGHDDWQRPVLDPADAKDIEHDWPVGTGCVPDWRLVYGLQSGLDGGTVDAGFGFEWWHLFRFQDQSYRSDETLCRFADGVDELSGEFGRTAGASDDGVYY